MRVTTFPLMLSPLVPGSKPSACQTTANLTDVLRTTEIAFAQTMADRDIDAFAAYLTDEAVFVSGNEIVRGPAVIRKTWSAFFAGDAPPFSWEPDVVEVVDSGTLGLASGPERPTHRHV